MEHVLFAVAIFIANIIQGLTGFAGSLLAMPPSINILGLIPAKVAVNTFGLVSSVILFVKNFRKLEWKEAVKIIILMGLGLGTGIALTNIVEGNILLNIYAVFIILVALKEMFYKGALDFNKIGLIIILFVAGLFQGLFVSGGPLLIIYVSKKIKDTNAHRGTLGLIWIFMNASMMIQQISSGLFTTSNITNILIGLPAVFLGVWIGGKLAQKLDRQKFLRIVYILLIISALTLIL